MLYGHTQTIRYDYMAIVHMITWFVYGLYDNSEMASGSYKPEAWG
jgi:hypothetical protein